MTAWRFLIGISLNVVLAGHALAVDSFFDLNRQDLHCGPEPEINLYEGIISALSQSDQSASELTLRKKS